MQIRTSVDSKLISAAREGNGNLLQAAINDGGNVNSVWSEGNVRMSAIHAITFNGSLSCLKMLVQALADVNVVDEEKNTPLHIAAIQGNRDVIQILIQNGCSSINSRSTRKNTPLHGAAINGHCGCIQLLLQAKANVTAADVVKNTALHFASANGHVKCVNILILAKAIIDAQSVKGNTPLHFSAGNGELGVVMALVSATSPLKEQIRVSVERVLSRFISKDLASLISNFAVVLGSDVNLRNFSGALPYDEALSNGKDNVMRYLSEY